MLLEFVYNWESAKQGFPIIISHLMEAFPFEPVILGDLRQPRSFLFLMIFCELPFLSAKVYQEYEICCFFFCRQVI